MDEEKVAQANLEVVLANPQQWFAHNERYIEDIKALTNRMRDLVMASQCSASIVDCHEDMQID